jgi:hypothetical protein
MYPHSYSVKVMTLVIYGHSTHFDNTLQKEFFFYKLYKGQLSMQDCAASYAFSYLTTPKRLSGSLSTKEEGHLKNLGIDKRIY